MRKKNHRPHKVYLAWEQAELQSNGPYARNLDVLTRKFPSLSMMELRVCALVKELLPSWKIAEKLGIDERTVENHRTSARHKMSVCGEGLAHYLQHL